MKKLIYKYPIGIKESRFMEFPTEEHFYISMPQGSEVLSVQLQKDFGTIWVLCNPKEKVYIKREFAVITTGHEFDYNNNTKFIGTYQMQNGNVVFHLFEILK